MKPEDQARVEIDHKLTSAGWIIQDHGQQNLGAGLCVASSEFPLARGFVDYLLIVNRQPVGVTKAKQAGTGLGSVNVQAEKYL